jgi:hypothetical protein
MISIGLSAAFQTLISPSLAEMMFKDVKLSSLFAGLKYVSTIVLYFDLMPMK